MPEVPKIDAIACVGWRSVAQQGGLQRRMTLDFIEQGFLSHFKEHVFGSDGGRDTQPFNRSAAKNDAAQRSLLVSGSPDEVLVFGDADTYVPLWQAHMAVEAVKEGKADLCFAHNGKAIYVASGVMRGQGENGIFGPFPGGVFAIRRSAFTQMGGFDEGFIGWGHEDVSFLNSADRIFGLRIAYSTEMGPLFKLDILHPRFGHEAAIATEPDSEEGKLYVANSERRDQYLALAAGDTDAYWKLKQEGNQKYQQHIEELQGPWKREEN